MTALTIWVGIDPGEKGAIAFLSPEGVVDIWDMKDPALTAALFRDTAQNYSHMYVAIEGQGSRPSQSSVSTFSQAESFGVLKGILYALEIPFEAISPQAWKKQLRIPAGKGDTPLAKRKDGKKKSMEAAEAMFPKAELRGSRGGALDGRAEALLIAEAIRQIKTGQA